jgi:hypothetical protein
MKKILFLLLFLPFLGLGQEQKGLSVGSKKRAWTKEGATQATNLDDVLVGDNVFHLGKINEGTDFTGANFADPNYLKKTIGNSKQNGVASATHFFSQNTNLNLICDPVSGDDNLDPVLYLSSPATNKFKTLTAAIGFAKSWVGTFVYIDIQNSSATTPATISGFQYLANKTIGFGNNAGVRQFVANAGLLYLYSARCVLNQIEFTNSGSGFIGLINSVLEVSSATIFMNPTRLTGTIQMRGNSFYDQSSSTAGSAVKFTAANQTAFQVYYGGAQAEIEIHGSPSLVSTNGFTGCRLAGGPSLDFTINLRVQSNAAISADLDISNCIVYKNGGFIAKQQFWQNSFGTNALNLGGPDPIIASGVRFFANHAAADADATLLSGVFYRLTGDRTLYQKP